MNKNKQYGKPASNCNSGTSQSSGRGPTGCERNRLHSSAGEKNIAGPSNFPEVLYIFS